jgi:hypothetical protein
MASLVAASGTAVVWLTMGLVTTLAMIALLVALVRHVLLVGRAARQLQDEIEPIRAEIERTTAARRRGGPASA